MTALFIINPNSTRVRKKGSILNRVHSKHITDSITLSDDVDLSQRIKSIPPDHIQWIFIEGGDGTLQKVMTTILRLQTYFKTLPRFTVLPGGMTNQVARNIGVKHPTPEKISSFLSHTHDLRTQTLPLLQLKVENAPSHYGFLFSSGAVPLATDFTKDQLYERGLGASLSVGATIFRVVAGSPKARDTFVPATPLKLKISGDGEETYFEGPHLGTLVTTLPGLILGIDPFWGEGDAPLRITYAHANARRLWLHTLGLLTRHKSSDKSRDGLESFTAHHLDYEYDGPIILDGEPISLPSGCLEILTSPPIEFAS